MELALHGESVERQASAGHPAQHRGGSFSHEQRHGLKTAEAENNLILGILRRFSEPTPGIAGRFSRYLLTSGGKRNNLVGAALMTPPRRIS